MDEQKKLSLFKKKYSNIEIAKITGHSYNSVKSMLSPGKKLPRWFKLVLHIWEI